MSLNLRCTYYDCAVLTFSPLKLQLYTSAEKMSKNMNDSLYSSAVTSTPLPPEIAAMVVLCHQRPSAFKLKKLSVTLYERGLMDAFELLDCTCVALGLVEEGEGPEGDLSVIFGQYFNCYRLFFHGAYDVDLENETSSAQLLAWLISRLVEHIPGALRVPAPVQALCDVTRNSPFFLYPALVEGGDMIDELVEDNIDHVVGELGPALEACLEKVVDSNGTSLGVENVLGKLTLPVDLGLPALSITSVWRAISDHCTSLPLRLAAAYMASDWPLVDKLCEGVEVCDLVGEVLDHRVKHHQQPLVKVLWLLGEEEGAVSPWTSAVSEVCAICCGSPTKACLERAFTYCGSYVDHHDLHLADTAVEMLVQS